MMVHTHAAGAAAASLIVQLIAAQKRSEPPLEFIRVPSQRCLLERPPVRCQSLQIRR